MHPFFMARGPAFRSGYQGDVFDNVDVYPLVGKIIGLRCPPNNGSFAIVSQLLRRKGFAMGSPVGWAMGMYRLQMLSIQFVTGPPSLIT